MSRVFRIFGEQCRFGRSIQRLQLNRQYIKESSNVGKYIADSKEVLGNYN